MQLLLKEWLEKRDVTQYQLAKAIGVSQPSVAAWINGRLRNGEHVQVNPDLDSLERICLFLKVPASDMLRFDPSKQTNTYENFLELDAA